MDTDDLTDETYNAIMMEAERFNHDLTIQFGLLSYHCDTEAEFINESEALVNEMKKYDMIDLEDIFYGNPPPIEEFRKVLDKLLVNISTLKRESKPL